MNEEKQKFYKSLAIIISFLALLWVIKISELLGDFSLVSFGLNPRSFQGLIGLVSTPLIHGNIEHLASNSLPILFLGTGLFYFYPKSSINVVASIWVFPGLFVWFIGSPSSYHVGASGIVYGLVTFVFFSGLLRKDKRSITLSFLVTFIYGGIIWGIFPTKEGVSWEYHLFGAIVGIIMAFVNRKKDPAPKYSWEEDDDDYEKPEKLEVDWSKEPPW